MRDSKISLDKARLQAARRKKGLTQADVAKLAKISLRTYSEYENKNDTRVSPLVMHNLATSVGCFIHDLWGEIPERALVFPHVTVDTPRFAEWVAEGAFSDLTVIGLPKDIEHREPLIELLKMHEDAEEYENERYSDLMQRKFRSEDCIKLLSGINGDSKDENEKQKSPKVRFAVKNVPSLNCIRDQELHPETNDTVKFQRYEWDVNFSAIIDFQETDFDTKGEYWQYVIGYKYHLPAFYGTGFQVDELSMDEQLEEQRKALNARPEIKSKEEEIDLSAEDIVADTPEVGQPDLVATSKEKLKTNLIIHKKDGNL